MYFYLNNIFICFCMCVCVCVLSCVWLFVTPWTITFQAPLSMNFSRWEYWSGLTFPSLGDLPHLWIEPMSLVSPALQGDSLLLSHQCESESCSSELTLCNPMHYIVHGIIQARILERVAHPVSRGSSRPRDQTQVFLTAGDCLPAEPRGRPLFPLMSFKDNSRGFSPLKVSYLISGHLGSKQSKFPIMCACAQSCPTLCDPMDCSPPGSSVHEIFQARILEWVAISYSRGSSPYRDQIHISLVSCATGRFFTAEPPGKLLNCHLISPKYTYPVFILFTSETLT